MQDKLKVDVSSSADVDGHLEANQLDISVGSSGSFSGKVWADYARFEVSSSDFFCRWKSNMVAFTRVLLVILTEKFRIKKKRRRVSCFVFRKYFYDGFSKISAMILLVEM